MKRKFAWAVSVVLLLAGSAFGAGDSFPQLTIAPWNGHKAASSLTFDDGDPTHLDVGIPELNKRGLHGTFFLIANKISRKDEWRKIIAQGHEIGNHTLDHKHAADLTPSDENAQVVGAQNVLQNEFGVQIYSFAYPFTEITPGLRKQLAQSHLLARGGGQVQVDLKPGDDPDWLNLPSRATLTALPLSTYQGWINQDLADGGWLIWMIHGLAGSTWYEPISLKNFTGILDTLQSKDIWVETLTKIGAYFRAQKVFEKVQPEITGDTQRWTWNIPDHMPPGVLLKIRLSGGSTAGKWELTQDGKKISPDKEGLYTVAFDSKALTLCPASAP